MNGKDIIATADFLSHEHGLNKEVVFEAIEVALAISVKKDYDPSARIDLKCDIDRKNGDYTISRKWTVVDDNEKNFDSEKHLYDDQAEELHGRPVEIGETFLTFLSKNKPPSRVSAQVFKNTIREQIRMAIKLNAQEKFTHLVGETFKVTVSRFMKSDILVSIDDNVEGVIKKKSLQRGDKLKIGQSLDVVLTEIVENYKGQQLIFDRNGDDFVKKIIQTEIPDIDEGLVEIKGFARDKQKKTIVSVYSSASNVDPVATCIGARGVRVKNIRTIIGGEAVEFVQWSDDSADFLSKVFGRKAENIVIDEDLMEVDVAYEDKAYDVIKNIKIEEGVLSKLTGFKVKIYTHDDFKTKTETVQRYYLTLLKEKLEIDDELATVLLDEGFEGFDAIAYTTLDDYNEIGFDDDLATELKSRALDVLDKAKDATSLIDLQSLSDTFVSELNSKDINSLEDLAYLSSEELKEDFLHLRSKETEKVIKEAKAIYFKDL